VIAGIVHSLDVSRNGEATTESISFMDRRSRSASRVASVRCCRHVVMTVRHLPGSVSHLARLFIGRTIGEGAAQPRASASTLG
jgi:hypothetical protein